MKANAPITAVGKTYGQGHQFFGLAPITPPFMALVDSKPRPFITSGSPACKSSRFLEMFWVYST